MKNPKKGTNNLAGTQEGEIKMIGYSFSFANLTSFVVKKGRGKRS